MKPGYWPSAAWPANYWPEDYWPDFADPPWLPTGRPMAFADYRVIGTWRIRGWERRGSRFQLRLEELKGRARVKVPTDVYTREAFPRIDEAAVGRVKPLAYGEVLRARAWCIDTDAKRFQVAGHAITRLLAVYMGGEPVEASSVDLTAATFELPGWDGTSEVTADFEGKSTTNPADVFQDLLLLAGETAADLDAASWAAARAAWLLGTDERWAEVSSPTISLYLDRAKDAWDVIGDVLWAAFGMLYVGPEGTYKLRRWRPQPAAGALRLVDGLDLASLDLEAQAADRITRVVARYRVRADGGGAQVVDVADEEARARLGLPEHASLEADLPFSARRDAEVWASRMLALRSRPLRIWTAQANQKALLLEPGDPVWIESDRRGVEALFEVIETRKDPSSGRVDLVLSDWRGMAGAAAWVMDSAETFPSHLGGGAADPWNDAWTQPQKEWARWNFGYVCDRYGFVSPGDRASYRKSTVS